MKNRIAIAFAGIALLATAGMAQNTLTVDPGCAMDGTTNGMRTTLFAGDTQVVYVQDDTPNGETVYRATFWFNPNGLSMNGTTRFPIFLGRDDVQGNVLRLQIQRNVSNDKYRLRLQVLKDNGDWANARQFDATGTDYLPFGDGSVARPITVEVVYGDSATSKISLTCNGFTYTKTGYWSSNWSIGHVRMGATRSLTSPFSGSMCFDEFESYRTLATP